jgi:hypothetical protein
MATTKTATAAVRDEDRVRRRKEREQGSAERLVEPQGSVDKPTGVRGGAGGGGERGFLSFFPLSSLQHSPMMHSRLVRRGTPAKDLLTGPSSAPERYRLLEELSTTRGDFASENAASRCVWTAEDTMYVPVQSR